MGSENNAPQTEVEEIVGFLQPDTRQDLRKIAVNYMAGISLSTDSSAIFVKNPEIVKRLLCLLREGSPNPAEGKLILATLINLSSYSEVREELIRDGDCVETLLPLATPGCEFADNAAKVLSNLTVTSALCRQFLSRIQLHSFLSDAVTQLTSSSPKQEDEAFSVYVGYILRNLSQLREARLELVSKNGNGPSLLEKLYSLLKLASLSKRKLVAVDVVRNCCFDTDLHEVLCTSENLMVALAYPLAGGEELKESEYEDLPVDLQYLEEDKKREESPLIRRKLIEAIYQICSTSKGREYLRNHGTYYILRELHKVEKDEGCLEVCENVIGVLIRTEPEMLYDNLREDISDQDLASAKMPVPQQ